MVLPCIPGRQSYSDHLDASVGLILRIDAFNDRQQKDALLLLLVVE
jgi:hypothetical protein